MGAMGTQIMNLNLKEGFSELLTYTNPEIVKGIHGMYADAGADIILTHTYGANRLKLGIPGSRVTALHRRAVKNAREAAPKCLIAGDIGPLDNYVEPLGNHTFDEAYQIFKEQAEGLTEADFIVIETFSDTKALRAAVIAVRDTCDLPIVVSMTFQDLRTAIGTDVESCATVAEALDVDAVGANCSEGPDGLLKVAEIFAKTTSKPICIWPNAGLPEIVNGKTCYRQSAKEFAKYAKKFYKLGVNIIGGCCGTTAEHIKAISKLKGKKPKTRKIPSETKLCSRTKTLTIKSTLVVGERINPTGKKHFQEELKKGKTVYIREQALTQLAEGASLLDINVGVAGTDEKLSLPKAISVVQSLVDAPIVIDTSDAEALELALKKSDGKALINSVNGSDKSLKTVLPLAKKYGAAVIALTLDHDGIPETKKKRIEIAKKIFKEAEKIGIRKEDIIVDCLVLTIATNPENENIILGAVKEIKALGYGTILGISNISHGLPNRSEINSKFLTKAMHAGLDLAIINPQDNIVQENTEIEIHKLKEIPDYSKLPIDKKLRNAILYGDEENILNLIEEGLNKLKPLEINNILIDALNVVGEKFNKKEYYLPQVLASAGAMKNAFSRLKKDLKNGYGKEKGKIIFATVENDIHDIGKNIVIALLESHNFKIIDLGTNIPKEEIIKAVKKEKPDLLALSALMTTTALEMEKVIKELRESNINIPVILGGAVITKDYSAEIKGHYAKDAIIAVKEINKLINEKNN